MHGRDILIALALATAFISAFKAHSDYVDRETRRTEEAAFERLRLARDQARWLCRSDVVCKLPILFPDRDVPPVIANSAPARTDALRAGAALASAEEGR